MRQNLCRKIFDQSWGVVDPVKIFLRYWHWGRADP